MKNIIKRTLSVLACAFMAATVSVMPVNAAGEAVSLTSAQGMPGEKVTVNVDVSCNNNFESLDIIVSWEDKALKAAQAKPVGKAMGASDAGDGYCTVVIYGSEALADGTVATIDFTIPSDAQVGKTYDIEVSKVNTYAIFEGPDIFSTVKVNNGKITVGEGGSAAVNNGGDNNNNSNNNNNNGQTATESTEAAAAVTTAAESSTQQMTAETTAVTTAALTTEKDNGKSTSKKGADALGALVIAEIIAGVILVYFGLGIAFGFLTKNMNKKKGYTGGFLWGFLLSIIGVIIVAVRKPKNAAAEAKTTNNADASDEKSE